MKLKEWLNSEVPNIASELIDVHNNYFSIEKSIGFEGQETIYKIL